MPPWSSNRLLSSSSRDLNTRFSNDASPAQPVYPPLRVTEADILDSALSIPTLTATTDVTQRNTSGSSARPSRTLSHGRSISHPFPSLFSSKKKRHGESGGVDSTDDDSGSSPVRSHQTDNGSRQSKTSDKDLTVGKCMTCDSTVRWPRNLHVFRCTVCLTINDLKPILLEARSGDGHRAPVEDRSMRAHLPAQVLSIEKTRRLIDQCITSYLVGCMNHVNSQSGELQSSPPGSPLLEASQSTPMAGSIRRMKDGRSTVSESLSSEEGCPSSLASVEHFQKLPDKREIPYQPRQADSRTYSSSSPGNLYTPAIKDAERPDVKRPLVHQPTRKVTADVDPQKVNGSPKNLFRPLEDYIITSFSSLECINASFSTIRPGLVPRAKSEGAKRWLPTAFKAQPKESISSEKATEADSLLSELDAKTLLLGDFAENGSWWTGGRSEEKTSTRNDFGIQDVDSLSKSGHLVNLKSPHIDWPAVNEWYSTVITAGNSWRAKLRDLNLSKYDDKTGTHPSPSLDFIDIESHILEAQTHTQRVLLKATESLLKRPGRPMNKPEDVRFLLIIWANPLLYPSHVPSKAREEPQSRSPTKSDRVIPSEVHQQSRSTSQSTTAESRNTRKGSSGQHSGIIKRILGLLANLPNECHHHLVSWFARFTDSHFQKTVDLVGSFVTYRLTRQHGKQRGSEKDQANHLIPCISGTGRGSSAALHAALGAQPPLSSKKNNGKSQPVVYDDDWQIKAAAKVMALLFSANNHGQAKKGETHSIPGFLSGTVPLSRDRNLPHGQIVATSDFYNTLLDYCDLIADFEAWEAKRGKFSFCQYPFFLSIWAKIQIMEHDARRQMEVKAREAFFDSIMTRQVVNQYLVLKIRRECLVEDSLKGVSEVVGSGSEEIKKGLRIEFKGEEGIDAGGLRKEWFLLLVRDVFNPEHGMFTYDEDSQFCYFNPNSFETTDQFFLVGVVLGLAIYNSTILDVALPPFAFRKLLAAGPPTPLGATSHAKPIMAYSLEDLAEYRPALAAGLRQLLDFEGDVEATFCRDFVADVEKYGQTIQVPLCPGGENRSVTNSNRREFVDLYVRYLLDGSVVRQFEPFKRGFFTVCGGNALSLFRPEEIELLIRGSDEPLDIASLRAVAVYEHWGVPVKEAANQSTVVWFWDSFAGASPKDQRKLLSFITGSDRIPAMGATNLIIKVSCLGNDCSRFPQARTCFNMVSLWRYSSKEKLERMLWRAVNESEGFGLK